MLVISIFLRTALIKLKQSFFNLGLVLSFKPAQREQVVRLQRCSDHAVNVGVSEVDKETVAA